MKVSYHEMANAIRFLTLDAVNRAHSGHPGMPIGMADVATVLFSEFMKFTSTEWFDRDRFILSAGHGSMLLYALLYLTGYGKIDLNDLKLFRQLHSKTAGHPEYNGIQGIETTTGPLGQGFGNAVGMAIAEKILAYRFGNKIVDHYTYTIVSDGCLMEGISHEAASLAGHLGLSKLIVLFDSNSVTIDGDTSLATSEDYIQRFRGYQWQVIVINGHDYKQISAAIATAREEKNKPSLIICKTIIGKYISDKAGTNAVHSWPLTSQDIASMRENLSWSHAEFVIPEKILAVWRKVGKEHERTFQQWQKNVLALEEEKYRCFVRILNKDLPYEISTLIAQLKHTVRTEQPNEATRYSAKRVLQVLAPHMPELIGGSADLSESNNTKVTTHITRNDFSGSYIHYGIREHAMAACMNGLALHHLMPYGGSFFVFTDYCRPAIRLAALMQIQVIYIMTHDSIGLGEDGPTHQPVEHLASLRAMPNLYVFRPADALETIACWEEILKIRTAPSVLVLSRQKLNYVTHTEVVSKGAYILRHATDPQITIFATGSEVFIAVKVCEILQQIRIRMVSMPCWELFQEQTQEYRDDILNNQSIKIAIEAGISFGWERYIGQKGMFIGVNSFGLSGPYQDIYEYFELTAAKIADKILDKYSMESNSTH